MLVSLLIALGLGARGAWRGIDSSKLNPKAGNEAVSLSAEELSANEVAQNDGSIHICIFSDRVEGLKCTLKSTALNAANPEKIHIWVVTDNVTSVNVAAEFLEDTGLKIHPLDLDGVVAGLMDAGHKPVWTWDQYNSSVLDDKANWDPSWANENTARPGTWDHSTMHMHPLNHLRFYIPHIKQFQELDRIIFMDDDLIIQGDVQRAWDAKDNLPEGKMLVGACEIWKWGDSTSTFQYSGKNSSYAKSSALALTGRFESDTLCSADKSSQCVGENHWENLRKRSIEINGKPFEPETQPEWNFGFTLFDLEQWRKLKLTDNYEQWMHANYDDHIFPETSLMYGLGVPFLTYYDHVACWDDVTEPKILVRDGFGYISYPEFAFNGLNASYLTSGFVLHYDGWLKPWYPEADPIFAIPYKKTMENQKAVEYRKLLEDPDTVKHKLDVQTSFVVLSEPRAGSGWLLDVLDQHPDICASGTHTSVGARVGFPHDIFLPYNKGQKFFDSHREKMRIQCYWSFIDQQLPRVIENREEWCEKGRIPAEAQDITRHMKFLCDWAERHNEESLNKAELFNEYFAQVMKANSTSWSCQCPQSAKVMGTRLMTDWIGSQFAGKRNFNFDMYERDSGAASLQDQTVPSVWKALEETKPKVIYFTRNIMDELISRKVAAKTGVFHVKTDADEQKLKSKATGITFDPHHAANELLSRVQHRRYIDSKLSSMDLDVLEINYESCMSDMGHCLNTIEAFLGVNTTFEYNFMQTRKSVQSNITEILTNYDEIIQVAAKKDVLSYLSTPWQDLAKSLASTSSLMSKQAHKKKVIPGSAWRTYPMNLLEVDSKVGVSDVFDHRAVHQMARAQHEMES